MKVLVTGGAGFIGSNLVDALVKRGDEVVVIDDLSSGKKEQINNLAKLFKISVTDKKIEKIFRKEKFDFVFHLAAQINLIVSTENPAWDCEVNISGSLNIFEMSKKYSVKKVIFSSSGGAIYGDTPGSEIPTPETHKIEPLSPYGIGKACAEEYLKYYHKNFKLPYISLRYANVYGPRQNYSGEGGVVAIFSNKILKNKKPIINGHGEQTRDFVFVEDVVRANLLVMESSKIGSYNISTAKETSINELFDKIIKTTQSKVEKIYGPAKLVDQDKSCLDNSLAKQELGWEPQVSLDMGLEKTINWFKSIS